MDEVPQGFRPCLSCTRSCYNEHWPFPDRDFFRPPCFVRALCDSNLAAMATCWMVIPSAWLKLYGDEVGNSAILHGPSGNTWQVGVGRPKWVAFRVGWRTFAADNCLEKGDMLVFTLIGNSEFSVKIFDSRTCVEKERSLTATNTGCYDSRSPVLLGDKRKHKDDDENPSELKRICLYENEGMHLGNSDQALKSFRNGTGLQQNRVKLSTFSSVARISQRDCALLDLNSKPLFIHQNPTSNSGRSVSEVSHQLLDAVDARRLQEYPSGIVYQPHPISVRSHDVEECSLDRQSKAQECASGGLGPATRFASQRRPVMDPSRERSSEFLYRQNNSSALITTKHCSQTLDLHRDHFAQAVGPQILSPAAILERGKALELARRAQDMIDRPSHMVVLRAFHVHGRAFVRFPVTFGKQHMPRKTAPMHLLDSNGHRWPMTWLRDNETHMGLTRGWRDFCLAEGLSEGDVCIFELIELNKLTLLIHVYRSSETRGSGQVVTKSKRLDFSHGRHLAHKRSFLSRKVSEVEGRGIRRELPLEVEDQLPMGIEEYHSFMPTKLVLYDTFHKTILPSSVGPNKGSNRRENLTAGSVGRERLRSLSLWASKEQSCTYSNQRRFSRETDSPEDQRFEVHRKENVDLMDNDMSKTQATTYGEILCQMSSGSPNANTSTIGVNSAARWMSTTTWNIELTENNSKAHTLGKYEYDGPHSNVVDCMKKHDFATASRRHEQKGGGNPGSKSHKQWAKSGKRYCKYDRTDNKRTLSWTWSTPSSAFKRKMQVSNRNPRIYLASRRPFVTEAQKEAAKQAALALKTMNPAALVVMKKSNVYRTYTVELPPSFSQQLSSDETSIFLLDAAGHITKALLTETALTRGWMQFSLDHLLEEGDVCVFELINISQLTVFVHIFRVVDIDHTSGSYWNHYRVISSGINRRWVKSNWKNQSHGQVVQETATIKSQSRRRCVNKSLYLAIRKTRAKHSETKTSIGNEWFCRLKPLDLNLNLDPGNVCAPDSNAPCDSPRRTKLTSWTWRHPNSKLFFELDEEPLVAKETSCVHESSLIPGKSPSTQNITKNIHAPSNETKQQKMSRESEKMLMTLPENEDSEPEEENYYRVVRILKKRYFQNEKQYLTELDGPVMQSDGYGGVKEYDDMKWWVPEKSFSSGFASCYLR